MKKFLDNLLYIGDIEVLVRVICYKILRMKNNHFLLRIVYNHL